MADVHDLVPALLEKIQLQLAELNTRSERFDNEQRQQTMMLVEVKAGLQFHTEQLADINRRLERLDHRTDRLEAGQARLEQGQKSLEQGQKSLDARVGRLAGQVGEVVRILNQDFASRLREVERRLEHP